MEGELHLLHRAKEVEAARMDSAGSSWSPSILAVEPLSPANPILPSVSKQGTAAGRVLCALEGGFCASPTEGEDGADGFSCSGFSEETAKGPFFCAPQMDFNQCSDVYMADSSGKLSQAVAFSSPGREETSAVLSPSESTNHSGYGLTKRAKVEQPGLATKAQMSQSQVKKLGEKITALQQLVSPFGKTDTASVLTEAIGYIRFLQDQVHVLSSPYMISDSNSKGGESRIDLRSRGLCLVPISSCAPSIANSNGADYWISGVSRCGS